MTRKASVLIEKDEHGFYAWFPELKGCQSEGATIEDALANIRFANICQRVLDGSSFGLAAFEFREPSVKAVLVFLDQYTGFASHAFSLLLGGSAWTLASCANACSRCQLGEGRRYSFRAAAAVRR